MSRPGLIHPSLFRTRAGHLGHQRSTPLGSRGQSELPQKDMSQNVSTILGFLVLSSVKPLLTVEAESIPEE